MGGLSTVTGIDVLTIGLARSLLFVPGSRPDRFASAARSGSDLVLIDLEDAVAPHDKDAAREAVRDWTAGGGSAAVRINAVGTQWFDDDVDLVVGLGLPVVVPKVESSDGLRHVTGQLPQSVAVLGIVETAMGIESVGSVAGTQGLTRLAFGNVDLAADLDVESSDRDALLYGRSRLVSASAAAGLPPPVDGVTTHLDASISSADAAYGRRLGFGGKLCIHPCQVGGVNGAYMPSTDAVAAAQNILNSYDGGVQVIDGQMIDEPVAIRARRIVQRALLGTIT